MSPTLEAPQGAAAGPRERTGDRFFRWGVLGFGLLVIALAFAIAATLAFDSRLAWRSQGVSFLWGTTWDPVAEQFGALPFVYGTLVSSALALLVAVPLGVGSAVFLAELAPRRVSDACSFLVELLAAVPSVVIGLIGVFALVPAMRAVGSPYGVGMLSAGLILGIMVLPYITSITREVLLTVPRPLKEAMLALGATRWEVVRGVSLPFARSGILGGVFLALGRALGETMAVTMVIGNTPKISLSLFDPGYSMAAVIANEFAEATGDVYVHALIAIGLVLFGITVLINGAARWMIYGLKARGGRA